MHRQTLGKHTSLGQRSTTTKEKLKTQTLSPQITEPTQKLTVLACAGGGSSGTGTAIGGCRDLGRWWRWLHWNLGNCACFWGSARQKLTDPQRKRTVGKSWRNQLHKTAHLTTENKRNDAALLLVFTWAPTSIPTCELAINNCLRVLAS